MFQLDTGKCSAEPRPISEILAEVLHRYLAPFGQRINNNA